MTGVGAAGREMTGEARGAGGLRVCVLGAGIVGVATAVHLRRAGHDVTLIDREGPAAGASFGNGGVLASSAIVPVNAAGLAGRVPRMLLDPSAPLFLRWSYLPRLAPWLLRYLSHARRAETARIAHALAGLLADSPGEHLALAEGTAAARYVVPGNYWYLYPDRRAFEADNLAWALRREAGFTFEEVPGEQFRAREPLFSDAVGHAVCLPGHGRITDPAAYVRALADHAAGAGVRMVRAEAEAVVHEAGRVVGVRAGGQTLACDAAVIALGAWSARLAGQLGLKVPLESERGYHLDLWEPSQMPAEPVMVAQGKFVVTPMEGRLRVAGVVEYGGLKAGPSAAPVAFLRRHVRQVLPALRWQRESSWMGHRPTTDDALPVIGEVPGVRGAWCAFGHQHVGLTAGPRTGRVLALLISGARPDLDLTPCSPARYLRRPAV